MRPGSSTDSAANQCAHRVGRIQNNGELHSAASGHRATSGGDWECLVDSTHSGSLFSEYKGAFLLTQYLRADHCVSCSDGAE